MLVDRTDFTPWPDWTLYVLIGVLVVILAAAVLFLVFQAIDFLSQCRRDRNASRGSPVYVGPQASINFYTIDQKLDTLLGGQTAMSKEFDDLKTAVETKVKALTDENTALKADAADHASDKQKATDLAAELAK